MDKIFRSPVEMWIIQAMFYAGASGFALGAIGFGILNMACAIGAGACGARAAHLISVRKIEWADLP